MQWMVISLLILGIFELPVVHAKKVVLMMSRPVRRSPSPPWRHLTMMMRTKKNIYTKHGYPGQRPGYPTGLQFYRPKDLHFAKDQYPQGGDDFDQGHEEVNHVVVPHGKGITHAVTFGKGYIPFETYKDHRKSISHHQDYKHEGPITQDIRYNSPMNYQSGPTYARAYPSQQAHSYGENEDFSQNELQDRIQERGESKYPTGKTLYDSTNAGTVGSNYGITPNVQGFPGKAEVNLPSVTPQGNTLTGSKQGIVLRDSIVLDDYHRKVAEFTKNWPSSFSATKFLPRIVDPANNRHQGSLQQIGVSRQFDDNNALQGFSGGTSFSSNLSQTQAKQGYSVKEDIIDTPHDFRTMPIQTAPVQSQQQPVQKILQQSVQQILQQPVQQILQQPVQQILQQQQQQQQQSVQHIIQHQRPVQHILQQQQPLQQIIHQQPVQQTLQQIFPQSRVPVNYALPNYQGYVHG